VTDQIPLKGGPFDGKILRTNCIVIPGEGIHIVKEWMQDTDGAYYLAYWQEARFVANRPDAATVLRFKEAEVMEA
jgi:hypothetical protein